MVKLPQEEEVVDIKEDIDGLTLKEINLNPLYSFAGPNMSGDEPASHSTPALLPNMSGAGPAAQHHLGRRPVGKPTCGGQGSGGDQEQGVARLGRYLLRGARLTIKVRRRRRRKK